MEERGLLSVQSVFSSSGWIFNRVPLDADYGKDAYVDIPKDDRITGITLALQIKSGTSFKRKSGYRIPVGDHRLTWMESTVPVFGIVYDPDQDRLFWQNITQFLRDRVETNVRHIVVPSTHQLDEQTIDDAFRQAAYRAWDITQSTVFLLNFFGSSEHIQRASVLDIRTIGHSEPRLIILLKASLRDLHGIGLKTALWVLGHFVPSRRLWLDHMKWTPNARELLRNRMHLDPVEIIHILEEMEPEDWQVEQSVNEMMWLIVDDPEGLLKLRQALELALHRGLEQTADELIQLICFLAGDQGYQRFKQVASDFPSVVNLPEAESLKEHLAEHQDLYLFSFAMDFDVRSAGRISREWPTRSTP